MIIIYKYLQIIKKYLYDIFVIFIRYTFQSIKLKMIQNEMRIIYSFIECLKNKKIEHYIFYIIIYTRVCK